jgi:predicted RNase H-like HicB family nuclease
MPKNTLTKHDKSITVNVEVVLFKEDTAWITYCPALELSSYGKTKADAKKAFEEVMEIFLAETLEKKTLEKSLLDLGWTLQQSSYRPPQPRLSDMKKYVDKKGEVYESDLVIPV